MRARQIVLRPGDRATRSVMREAHDSGRHGDGSQAEIVAYWASCCCDCNAVWRYEHSGLFAHPLALRP